MNDIARMLHGDNCQNIDRLMRVPFTINLPTESKRRKGRTPALSYLTETDWEQKYSLDRFFDRRAGPHGSTHKVGDGR